MVGACGSLTDMATFLMLSTVGPEGASTLTENPDRLKAVNAEVEAVLSRHPGVMEVAVVGVASAEWGETVVAYVVGGADPVELAALAEAELASYKRPREVRVVDALPRNALGKVVRGALREGPEWNERLR